MFIYINEHVIKNKVHEQGEKMCVEVLIEFL